MNGFPHHIIRIASLDCEFNCDKYNSHNAGILLEFVVIRKPINENKLIFFYVNRHDNMAFQSRMKNLYWWRRQMNLWWFAVDRTARRIIDSFERIATHFLLLILLYAKLYKWFLLLHCKFTPETGCIYCNNKRMNKNRSSIAVPSITVIYVHLMTSAMCKHLKKKKNKAKCTTK